MLPNPGIVFAYVIRHLRLWLLLRIGFSGLFLFTGTDPLRVTPWTAGAIVVICAMVSVVEVHRRHEWDLLGNLGVGRGVVALLMLTPPVAGEVAVRALATLR